MEDQSLDDTHKITSLSPLFFLFEIVSSNKKNLIFLLFFLL
jgi:hypothetical protein